MAQVAKKRANMAFMLLAIICIILLEGCTPAPSQERISGEMTINDIAYDVNESLGYTVYILENEQYVPFLVLTNDYNGNSLLVRMHLLDESDIFNDYSSYYPQSHIDSFLNGDYFSQLSSEVQGIIVDTQIIATAKASIGICGQEVEQLERKVFLLSYTELGFARSSLAAIEGNTLKYFNDDSQRYVAFRGSAPGSWWLRTSYTLYENTGFGIGPEGTVGGGAVYEVNGIRPAFCLPNDTAIHQSSIDGNDIYIIG